MLTFEGILKLVQEGRPFTDRETGVVTPAKFINFFQVEDDEGKASVLELRSKENFKELVDKPVVGTVLLYPMREGSGFYLSLDTLVSAEGGE